MEANMTASAQAKFKNQARIIKALAHSTRLFIVDELSRGERCVCELKDMIGVEMPTVSRHLGVLKDAGQYPRFYSGDGSGVSSEPRLVLRRIV